MNLRKIKKLLPYIIIGLAIPLLTGCFTGVEGTSKINLTKKDITATNPTEEDLFLSTISPETIGNWTSGKRFMVADDKFRIIAEGSGGAALKVGDILRYNRAENRSGADGDEKTVLYFDSEGGEVKVSIEKPLSAVENKVTISEIPMLIELDLVEKVDRKMRGKRLWTRTGVWYDDSLNHKRGRKFIPVTVNEVKPGNAFFPLIVRFVDDNGESGTMLMNIGNTSHESRNFGKLFSLTDPRNSYKNITPENWAAIQMEQVRPGMTKEECKLAKGNPKDVDMGHNYSNAMEIWYYPDGTNLRFIDGVLVR